jgi:hypothetical protein
LGRAPTFQSNWKNLAALLKFEQLKSSIYLPNGPISPFFSLGLQSKKSSKNFLHFLLKTIAETQSFGYF